MMIVSNARSPLNGSAPVLVPDGVDLLTVRYLHRLLRAFFQFPPFLRAIEYAEMGLDMAADWATLSGHGGQPS